MLHSLALPKYETLKQFEGKGNFAINKYYQFPYRFFYRHKLKMIISLMPKGTIYRNILDFGCGPGIFTKELKKHALAVKSIDTLSELDSRWSFDAVVCSSVLEFAMLDVTLRALKNVLKSSGALFVASPMETPLSNLYFNLIKDKYCRNSHEEIIKKVSVYFSITEMKTWFGFYFALKAVK